MGILEVTSQYEDSRGNKVISESANFPLLRISFQGENNVLSLESGARLSPKSIIKFCGDNGKFSLAGSDLPAATLGVRIGSGSEVTLGRNVTTTGRCLITASEGAKVALGDDVMIAAGVQIRSDDAHPIYDANSHRRINPSKHIKIGNHVWLAYDSIVMGGSWIGDNSIVGIRSLVRGQFEPNLVLVGSPAIPVRQNATWSRKVLSDFPEDLSISEHEWRPVLKGLPREN
ncbi:acyltransferase [Glutamicibacter soli]